MLCSLASETGKCYTFSRCRDNEDSPGFEAVKGKELYGVLYGHVMTRNGKDADVMDTALRLGFEGHPFSLWLENGTDISV
jgi:hypothetical protein